VNRTTNRSRWRPILGPVVWSILPWSIWACSSRGGESATRADGGTGTDARTREDAQDVAPSDGATVALDASDASDGGSGEEASDEGTDGGQDACTGSVAVVGGTVSGASTIAFAASLLQGGSWTVASLPSNVASPPAIAAYDGGFIVVFVDAAGDLEFSTSTWSWSSPGVVAGRKAINAPSLAVVGASLHLVYQGSDSRYLHGTYTAAGWDGADDPIGGAAKQGFGPDAPVAQNVAGTLLIAYGGQNGSLYDESWTQGAWAPDTQHTSAQIGSLSPAVAALDGGASDTLVVYASAGGTLYFTSRSGGVWSAPEVLDTNAFTSASPSLAALASGRAMLAYLGTDGHAYSSVYDASVSPPWTSPAPMDANGPTLLSPPSIAPGVCGDDAVAVLAGPAGVATVRHTNGAWQPSTILAGTAGMTFASVASRP
jgi:hypothetical protein